MIKFVAAVLGFNLADGDVSSPIAQRMARIAHRVTVPVTDATFEGEVIAQSVIIDAQGASAFEQALRQVTAGEPERVYKIKRVAKGQRIKIASASGKHFSFGPVWVLSIQSCRGIVLNDANREKLNMHGEHVGVKNPSGFSARDLCQAIASMMDSNGNGCAAC